MIKITKGLIEGALLGGGLGALLGAAGGKKSTVAAGAVGGAVVGGAIGYALQGLAWDIEHFKFPNPFAGLENWFNNLGKGLSQWAQGVSKELQAATSPVPPPGVNYVSAAVQPGTGGQGAISPAVSPIHATEITIPRVVQLEAGGQIKGTPLFPKVTPYTPSPGLAREMTQLATTNAPPSAWESVGAQVYQKYGATWIIMPSGETKPTKLQTYIPGQTLST
jgi:hypothetical protein